MRKVHAVSVRNTDGVYQIYGERQPWAEVKSYAESVRETGDLIGWGEYTKAYEVDFGLGYKITYFVEAS